MPVLRWVLEGDSSLEEYRLLDVTPCGSCMNPLFGGTYRLHHEVGQTTFLRSVLQLLVTANVVPSSLIVSSLKISPELRLLTRTARRHIREDGILDSHRLENHKVEPHSNG
jgi:hypothetical protein